MSQEFTNEKVKDSSSKIIFKDPILCAQFLRGYVDIPILKSVKPEGIEDVTERYVHMFAEERNSDVVKKVHIEMNETPFFLVSLIEHKSNVDYNVVMQILRYMVFIWEDYEKEMERQHRGISKTKSFKYPPILPVIFYDGADNWAAAAELHERILFSDMFAKYIPDYQCILVQLKDYSNAELLMKKEELSIVMLIDKLKSALDYAELNKEIGNEYLTEITAETPEYLLSIIAQVVEILLVKLNVPIEELEAFTMRIKERKMGELLAHFQGWDVQAIRKESREEGIEKLVKAMNVVIDSKEAVAQQLVAQYELTEEEAAEKVEMYWQS
ncbi:MAG: Rpn family recombination-promoting nuclease/putative transposase [Lachnospiraceae bacterium]|nr:Rpn family recombination-promoting nuclease/putative transposase [Lachnospiraceae bacterium]